MVRGRALQTQGFVAQLMTLIANCHRNEKKKRQPFQVADFMPRPKRTRRDERRDAARLDSFLGQFPQDPLPKLPGSIDELRPPTTEP